MSRYRCEECLEEFDYRSTCITHMLETDHTRYWLIGTDVYETNEVPKK